MVWIRPPVQEERDFYRSLDRHLSKQEFKNKQMRGECYVLVENQRNIGVLRYGLFWDNTPFLNLIVLSPEVRHKGLGRAAVLAWEKEMHAKGYPVVMTSTQADEPAQHFYRKLGYKECGCLVLHDIPEMAQPMEIFFIKRLVG